MRSFTITPDAILLWKGLKYRVSRVIDSSFVLGVNLHTGELDKIPTGELRPVTQEQRNHRNYDLSDITPKEWNEAETKLEIIRPLLELKRQRTSSDVSLIAKSAKKSPATIYRWIRYFEENGTLTSLIRRERLDQGGSRLDEEQDKLILHVIEEEFLTKQRRSIAKCYSSYLRLCKQSEIEPCSKSTFSRRVKKIAPRERALRRHGPKLAKQNFDPATENFPAGNYPLDAVQIDHTKPNIIIVDDDERKPLGRPWVTFAIDTFSRAILGFLLSLEAPSASSVALCMTNAVCRKEKWLRNRNIDASWPVWGKMRALYADNGPDFRCIALNNACKEHSITLTWRPLGKPEYGGHVERLMRTVKTDLSDLKGTTFSHPSHRGEYDSEGNAIFTFSDLEEWLTIYITKYYHQRGHTGIGTSPLKKWEHGLFYGDSMPPTGLPPVLEDEHRFYLDFLPFERRTVQRYGIELDNIQYFHPSISKWIGVKSNSSDGKFTIKYERHQVAYVYFYDPDSKEYLEIPRVHRSAPSMTRFELKKAKALLKQKGISEVDEFKIMEAQRELAELAENAEKRTKKVRRDIQRSKVVKKETSHLKEKPSSSAVHDELDVIEWGNTDGFSDIEVDLE